MTSVVLACEYEIRDYARWWEQMGEAQADLARLGVRHVVVYRSVDNRAQVFVTVGLRAGEPFDRALASPRMLRWFDAAGVEDIPPMFVGTLAEKISYTDDAPQRSPVAGVRSVTPGVIVASVFRATDYATYIARVHAARELSIAAGIRQFWIYRAVDDDAEIMSLQDVDSLQHAQRWLDHPEAIADFYRESGVGVYPPIFIGTVAEVVEIDGG